MIKNRNKPIDTVALKRGLGDVIDLFDAAQGQDRLG
jgi:hypothetical protein